MQIALVGLAQSGKSTLFSAVTEGHVPAGGDTQHASKAVVKVPDTRLDILTEMYHPKKTTHATIDFLDLPGLSFVDESHRQEARRVIAEARQCDMLLLVVCGFKDSSVAAYRDRVDPVADLDELRTELLLADLELITNRIEKLKVSVNKPSKTQEQDKKELPLLEKCAQAIEDMKPISDVVDSPEQEKMLRSFGFLTLKPTRVVVNVGESDIEEPCAINEEQAGGPVISLCARLEAELAALDPQERNEFLQDMGITQIARDTLVVMCYQTLELISFLTVGPDEVRAWTVGAQCPALEAAGEIHSDIQRGFIRAETVHYDDLIAAGDMKAAKAAGKVRLEGKTYIIQDGDIINFRFNV
ncbi:MAG: redox-regulated ATPase YchF [Sedimentisphaerales bacterium]|nr:redox-regulated ATPase YchF [Sedimentisphaerales bacterium]